MTVYVDNAFIKMGRMLMCHMIADTDKELHEMAQLVGLKRECFRIIISPIMIYVRVKDNLQSKPVQSKSVRAN